MPSSITHQLIAEESAKNFPPDMKAAAEQHEDYFFLGAQGPDLYFFYRPFSRKEGNTGKFMHRKRIRDVFELLLSYLRELDGTEYSRMLAYAAGYITHYCADTAFHPFVYAYLKEHGKKGLTHQQIENDWDVHFLRVLRGREAEYYEFPFAPKKINLEGTLYRFFDRLCRELNRRRASERKFAAAVRLFYRYLRILHGKCYKRNAAWARAEIILHTKPRLSCLYARKYPHAAFLGGKDFFRLSGERGHGADELFEIAVKEAERLTQTFQKALKTGGLPPDEFDKSFLTAEKE